ncbi:hypothetical protein [Streptomyces sp. NPDC001811]
MSRDDMPACVRWEILMHQQFNDVWICKDLGRATTRADPAELGRAVLAAYLAGRDSRGETFRVLVRTDHGHHVVITADHLTDPGWKCARQGGRPGGAPGNAGRTATARSRSAGAGRGETAHGARYGARRA